MLLQVVISYCVEDTRPRGRKQNINSKIDIERVHSIKFFRFLGLSSSDRQITSGKYRICFSSTFNSIEDLLMKELCDDEAQASKYTCTRTPQRCLNYEKDIF